MRTIFKSPILMALVGFLLYFFLKKENRNDELYTGGSYTTPLPGGTITNPNGSVTVISTITESKARALSEQLYERLYMDAITSDSDILNLLKGLNEADYKMIYTKFGLKASGLFGIGEDLDLTEYIIKDVSESAVKKLAKLFPSFF